MHRDVKMLVVACNSIEVERDRPHRRAGGHPGRGRDRSGRALRRAVTRNGRVGLIGTEATVASGAYDRAVAATGAPVTLSSRACPVFVEHVERGDTTSDELRRAARGYLSPLMADGIDTLIMGCTHYPLLSGLLQLELGPDVVLVSSAEETAKDVYATLVAERLLRDEGGRADHEFLSTGDPEAFERVAGVFLGPELTEVERPGPCPREVARGS